MDKAKELIRVAKESGANAVKGQAFVAEDMLQWGSMPLEFYKKCALKYEQYKELIAYGSSIDIPVFFTILSKKLEYLAKYQVYRKLHAAWAETCYRNKFFFYDHPDCLISLKKPRTDARVPKQAKLFYATPYLKDADWAAYEEIRKFYEMDIGISHHGQHHEILFEIHRTYGLPHVEKHFFLGDELSWDGQVYRDCLHSYNPSRFERLAKDLSL
jgi:sialic acid synthase SpsE